MKKIIILLFSLSMLCCGFYKKEEEFRYEFEVILNSNEFNDVKKGYVYKEYLIDVYNDLIMYLDESLIKEAVNTNINSFAYKGSKSFYSDGRIVVVIGNGKGESIKGSLKTNYCDTSKIRTKFFFSKFFN